MAGHPSAGELVAAVRAFLDGLPLTGREAFHAKVAANALAIVERELAARADAAGARARATPSFAPHSGPERSKRARRACSTR